MISKTRTMSTSGVTLIAVISSSSSPLLAPPATSALVALGGRFLGQPRRLQVRENLARERLAAAEARLDHADEEVEEGDRRQRDQEADRRGDERLADLRHQAARDLTAALIELVERPDDADDGAEQPDERRDVSDGADEREAALHRA